MPWTCRHTFRKSAAKVTLERFYISLSISHNYCTEGTGFGTGPAAYAALTYYHSTRIGVAAYTSVRAGFCARHIEALLAHKKVEISEFTPFLDFDTCTLG